MDNIYDLLNNLKTVSKGTQKASSPMKIDYAEVTKVDPLELDFGEFKVEEDDELLTTSQTIKILQEGKIKYTFDCPEAGRITREFELEEEKKLKIGDPVICLQSEGGEGWVVIDKAEVEDEE